VQVVVPLSLFDCTQGHVHGGKSVSTDQKYLHDPAAWVLPGKINGTENYAHCNWGFTTLLGEVSVRFNVLLSLFDRTQGRVRGGKTGRQS
jgi:hypothetical protein